MNPTIELPELTQDWEIDSWRAQTGPCVHQDPGERSSDPTRDGPRLACESPGVSGRGVGRWCPAGESGALNAAVHAQDLLKEVIIHPTIEPLELNTGLQKHTLGGHKQNLVCTRTQEKGAVTPQETGPACL